jgi:membrane protein YqaA with SNARE-associated domain
VKIFNEITLTSIGTVVVFVIMILLIFQWPDWRYSSLASLVGGLVGWLLGVLLSPFSAEKELFASYSKAAQPSVLPDKPCRCALGPDLLAM